ncbi:MAG: TetR/AcrR family transcriptional regulator [Sediminibacterium sp.]
MKPTKQHIQDHALKLFNQKGFVNVRLQHIADAAFVSVGHLAYHFKTKDDIIKNLYEELRIKQINLLNEFRVVPLFEDINRYLIATFQLQTKYIFFYVDTLEVLRAHPEIYDKHSFHIQWQLTQLKIMLNFNCARGSLHTLSEQEQQQLAWQLRSFIDMWPYIKKIESNSKPSISNFLSDIWHILNPYFTDTGRNEFYQLSITKE